MMLHWFQIDKIRVLDIDWRLTHLVHSQYLTVERDIWDIQRLETNRGGINDLNQGAFLLASVMKDLNVFEFDFLE